MMAHVVRALLGCLAVCAMSCGSGENGAVTYAYVTVQNPTGVEIDQLRFEISQDGGAIGQPALRPETPSRLVGNQDVTILLPDGAADSSMTIRVVAFHEGLEVTSGRAERVFANRGRGVDVVIAIGHILESLAAQPSAMTMALGEVKKIEAMATFSDEGNVDIAALADWVSADPSIVTVSGDAGTSGLVTSVAEGATTITFTYPDHDPITVPVTVGPRAMTLFTVAPMQLTVALGETSQLQAMAVFSDGQGRDVTADAAWISANPGVATVGAGGVITPVSAGLIQIAASYQGQSASASVSIVPKTLTAISVEPASGLIAAGFTQQYFAFGIYSDGSSANITSSVAWSSSAPGVASLAKAIGREGLVTGVAPGTATIQAFASNVVGSTDVTVTDAQLQSISISPANQTVAAGTEQVFTATGLYTDGSSSDVTALVAWSSSAQAVALVQDATHPSTFSALAEGDTTITATLAPAAPASTVLHVTAAALTAIEVSPSSPSLAKGSSQQLIATALFSDGTRQDVTASAAWATNASSIVSVSSSGYITAQTPGSARITAIYDGIIGTASVTSTAAIVTAIAVTPATASVAVGTTQQLTARATYSDATTQDVTSSATWSTSAASIATVTNSGTKGLARGVAAGSATITAVLSGVTGTSRVTVTAVTLQSVMIAPSAPSLPLGQSQQLTATGTYSDGSFQDITAQVTWASSSPSVIAVSNAAGTRGSISAGTIGSAIITATGPGGVSGTITAYATNAVVTDIVVTPSTLTIAAGVSRQLTAMAAYSDGSEGDVTGSATWTTSHPAIASVSNGADIGTAKGLTQGSATITARLGAVQGTSALTVSASVLTSITIDQGNISLPQSGTQRLTATGHYSDGDRDITANVTWAVSDTSIAGIGNSGPDAGKATASATKTGTTNVTARLGTVTNTPVTTITVTAATLQSITIAPANVNVQEGKTVRIEARGRYSNGTEANITTLVTWSSASTATATITNGADGGIVTGIKKGATTVTCTLTGVTAPVATVTVNECKGKGCKP